MTTPTPDKALEVAERISLDGERYTCSWDDAIVLARAFLAQRSRLERMEGALREIAHAPGYDGSLCPDPDDCPNCAARAALEGA